MVCADKIKIDLKLIKKPNKRLLACISMYTIFSRAKHYCNQNNMDLLVGFSLINKDWYHVLDHIDESREICTKLFDNKKLNKNETKFVKSSLKVYRSYNKVDPIYYNIIEDYKKEILSKVEDILKPIFSSTNISLKIIFIYQPLVGTIKGSSFKNGIAFNIENKNVSKDRFYSILSHEIIHSVCSNNKEYSKLYRSNKLNLKNLRKSKSIFNETFTTTIENIILYNLGLEKKLFSKYRFSGQIYNLKACKMEDNIRNVYIKWNKLRSKNKINFVKYLSKNIDEISKI
jgi:hypothetical protein